MNNDKIFKYQGNGISFDYPVEYNINPINGINGRFLEGIKDHEHTFEISKKIIDTSFDDEVKIIKSSIEKDFTLHDERNIIIAGVPGYQISYSNELLGYNKRIFFDKNDVRYIILIDSDSNLDIISETFKVLIKCDCGSQNEDHYVFCSECGLRLTKSNKNTLQKTVNELEQIAMQYGFMVSKNEIFSNWQYHKPFEVYFSKNSAIRTIPGVIVPPDLICFENISALTMFDNEFENNLKAHIFLKMFIDDLLIDNGSISLKIYDIEFEDTEEQTILSFICDFD